MDRILVFNDEQFRAADPLNLDRFAMIGLAKLSQCVLGNGTFLNNLPCTPTAPASMDVILGAGEIYSIQNVDDTPYGALPADTTHQILKQGLLLDSVNFTLTAPITPGDSVDYLIQITYQDNDNTPENRPYFGQPDQVADTIRSGVLTPSLKPGVPAPSGTQVTPTPDAGYVGAWVITVANGQTSILSGDISQYPNAPFVTTRLPDALTQTTADARYAIKSVTNTFGAYQNIPQLYSQVNFASGAGDQQTIPPLTNSIVEFNNVFYDPHTWWDPLNFRMIPGMAGVYRVTCILHKANVSTQNILVSVFVNGVYVRRIGEQRDTTYSTTTFGSMLVRLSAPTDYIDIQVYNADAAQNIVVGMDVPVPPQSNDINLFEVHYLGT